MLTKVYKSYRSRLEKLLTLHEKVTGKMALQVKSGSKNYLTDEEASLVNFLIDISSHGPVHVQVLIFLLSALSITALLFCFLPLHNSILLYLWT